MDVAGKLKGGISESGTVEAPWALARPGRMVKTAKKLAQVLDCPRDDHRDLLGCLQEANLNDLVMAQKTLTVRQSFH